MDSEDMKPSILGQLPEHLVFPDDLRNFFLWRLNENIQAHRLMLEPYSITHGLERETGFQVAAVPFEDAEGTDHIVQHLVSGAVDRVVNDGAVVLQVDPARHDDGSGHDELEHGEVPILLPVITMQEGTSPKIESSGDMPRRRDEGGTASESPFRSGLRPVPAALPNGVRGCG